MPPLSRRQILRLGSSVGAVGLAGCTALGNLSDDAPESGSHGTQDGDEYPPCDEYVYESNGSEEDGALPYDLRIRNIALSTYSVSISITDLSGATPEGVVSCAATSEAHTELVFDLSPETQYRVHVSLNRPDTPEEASMTVWGRRLKANAALEVTVESGGFLIRRIHYDKGVPTPTEG